MTSSNQQHIVGLDILRLFAAMMVMCYHFVFIDWIVVGILPVEMQASAPEWGENLHFGWIGVEVFFVISGFVIANAANGAYSATRFLQGRVLRLAPASWIAATITFISYAALQTESIRLLVVGYIQTLLFWPLNAIDAVWWTLGIEIDFYLLVYFLIKKNLTQYFERIMIFIGSMSALFWIAALTMQWLLAGREGYFELFRSLVIRAQGNRELQLLLVQHGCLFALGVILWKTYSSGLDKKRFLFLSLMVAASLLEIWGQNGIIIRTTNLSISPLPAIAVWIAFMAFFVISLVYNDVIKKILGSGTSITRFMGIATYPLYLVHQAIGRFVMVTFWPYLKNNEICLLLAAIFSLTISFLIAVYLEPAVRDFLFRRIRFFAPRIT